MFRFNCSRGTEATLVGENPHEWLDGCQAPQFQRRETPEGRKGDGSTMILIAGFKAKTVRGM